ncbi:MAG: hypothetical protein F9K40_01190 [Kofleriaceae bacterium]|nr:MAG: hypothetical protein F9K40_01190 [Kofleriaceae bacterium]MBZ0234430.1 hypothetical protein [Kofleriaceae bacterium]
MIESIEGDRIGVRCVECRESRAVELRGIEVRTLNSATAVVALPTCACGAVEFLVRAMRPEPEEPGGTTHRHQLLVDHLHATLARQGRVTPDSKDAEKVCPEVARDVLARWFPDGFSLWPGDAR